MLAVSASDARLGDTETQALVQRPAAIAVGRTQLEGGGVLLIIEDKDTEYTAGFLDGRSRSKSTATLMTPSLRSHLLLGNLRRTANTGRLNRLYRT